MSCFGVHFALTEDDVKVLRSFEKEKDRLTYLQEEIEEQFMEEPATYAAESDKARDAMHRTLADGHLSWDGGTYPLNHTVLAGELLYTGDDYIMSLKSPAQVKDVAGALEKISEGMFRDRYNAIPPSEYGMEPNDDDFSYIWEWFQNVRALYGRAASEGRYVLFTANQ